MTKQAKKTKKKKPQNKSQPQTTRKTIPSTKTPTPEADTIKTDIKKHTIGILLFNKLKQLLRIPSSTAFWTCIATIFIAYSTFRYTGVSNKQLTLMEGQWDYLRESSQIEQRAWLGVVDAVYDTIEADKPFTGKMIIQNTGKTPATIINMGFLILLNKPNLDLEPYQNINDESIWEKQDPKQINVPPNATYSWNFSIGKQLTPEEVESIKSEEKQLYVIGFIIYMDFFGNEHQTRSSYLAQLDTIKMQMYHNYNYMD